MRIGIDASRANSAQRTGVENYAFFIIEELKKQIGSEHEVILYTREQLLNDMSKLPDNWKSKVLKIPFGKFWTQVRLSWEMFRRPVDVLYVPAHVMPLVHPKKTIATVHDVAPMRYPKSYSSFENWYIKWSTRFALKKASKVIVPSEFTKSEIRTFFKEYKGTVVEVVPGAYDKTRFNKNVNEERSVGYLKEKSITQPYVLFVGRLEDKKDLVGLVNAFGLARDKCDKSFKLVLAGKPGFGYEHIQKAIDESKYNEDILQLGYVEDDALPSLYKSASLFVFATQYEGFGIPVLEAFACGTPVVIRGGGACEEVAHGRAIVVDDSEELLVNALCDSVSGFNEGDFEDVISQYSWSSTAQKIVNILLG